MEARELRLNNFIQIDEILFKVSIIKEEFISFHLKNPTLEYKHTPFVHISKLEPIPLTEEWLLKFGFKYGLMVDDHGQHIDINIQEKQFFVGGIDACITDHGFVGKVEYVHQLQNLYFALTGIELSFNVEA